MFMSTNGFVLEPSSIKAERWNLQQSRLSASSSSTTTSYPAVDERTGKATGVSYLPESTIRGAEKGSPVEKIKLEKDGTSAFVDIYEYARKIRQGELTWEEVDKADLDSVSKNLTRIKDA